MATTDTFTAAIIFLIGCASPGGQLPSARPDAKRDRTTSAAARCNKRFLRACRKAPVRSWAGCREWIPDHVVAVYLPSPTANMGKPPLPTFVLQLEESRAEWRRRHPPPWPPARCPIMNKSAMMAAFFTVLVVLGVVAYRLLWAASSVASAAGLGRLPKLPKSWRRRLFDERNDSPS